MSAQTDLGFAQQLLGMPYSQAHVVQGIGCVEARDSQAKMQKNSGILRRMFLQ